MSTRSRTSDYFVLAFITLAWGLTWPVTIVGLRFSDPILLAALRCILGGAALAAWRGMRKPGASFNRKDLATAARVGLFWVGVPTAFAVWALQYIPGGLGAILQSTVPFFVAIFSHFYLGEKQLNAAKIGGLLIGFIGIVVLFSDDPVDSEGWVSILGGGLIILGSVAIGYAQVYSRKHFKGEDLVGYNMYMQLFGGGFILPFAFLQGVPIFILSYDLTLVLLYLSIVATAIPFTLYYELFRRVDIVVLSMMAYVIPIVAVAAGIVWLGESLTGTDIVGAMLVLIGVVLATQFSAWRERFHRRTIGGT